MGVFTTDHRFLQQFRQLPRLHVADTSTQRERQVVERHDDFLEIVGDGFECRILPLHRRLVGKQVGALQIDDPVGFAGDEIHFLPLRHARIDIIYRTA